MSKTNSSTQRTSSSGAAYPSSYSNDSKATGRGDNWIKVSSQSDTIEMDHTLFINQPINPFKESKRLTNTQSSRTTNNTLYVQDSGLVMSSSSRTSSRQSLSSTNSGSSNGSIDSSNESEGSQQKQGLEDDWEIVYPDD